MIDLGHIVSGKEEPYKIIEKIIWFEEDPKTTYRFNPDPKPNKNKKISIWKHVPCEYMLPDHRIFICDKTEIVKADFTKATSKIGELFRIPNEYIENI